MVRTSLEGMLVGALALGACSSGPTPCQHDMPGPGAGCNIVGTWTGGKGKSTVMVTFTDTTYTGTFGGIADSGVYTITGGFGCDAAFTIGSNEAFTPGSPSCGTSFDAATADAGPATATYGIVVGSKCTTFSLSTQIDACEARALLLGGAQLTKQQ